MDRIKLDARFEFIESNYLNPQFKKAKCYIAYYNKNRNKSNIPKSAFEEAIPSLFNVPVVAEYLEEVKDFGDHGGKIEITDKGVEYIQTTKPYGVVSESCNPRWELVTEESGFQREYLVCDVTLWVSRYPELEILLSNKNNQSMEIEVLRGHMQDDKYYFVEEFIFSALCILGSDVTPCFENSSIKFNLDKETFKSEFKLMLEELKQFSLDDSNNINNTISQKGGNDLETNKIENIKEVKEEFTTEPVEEVISETPIDEFTEEQPVVENTTNDETTEEPIEEPVVETIEDEVKVEEFAPTEPENFEENVEEPIVEKEFNVLETEEYKILEEKFSALEQQFNALTEEIESLRTFKANKLKEELKVKVDNIVSQFSFEELDIIELKTKAYNEEISLETLQEKLFALVGKKNFSAINKEQVIKPVTFSLKETEKCPYTGLEHLFNK